MFGTIALLCRVFAVTKSIAPNVKFSVCNARNFINGSSKLCGIPPADLTFLVHSGSIYVCGLTFYNIRVWPRIAQFSLFLTPED